MMENSAWLHACGLWRMYLPRATPSLRLAHACTVPARDPIRRMSAVGRLCACRTWAEARCFLSRITACAFDRRTCPELKTRRSHQHTAASAQAVSVWLVSRAVTFGCFAGSSTCGGMDCFMCCSYFCHMIGPMGTAWAAVLGVLGRGHAFRLRVFVASHQMPLCIRR